MRGAPAQHRPTSTSGLRTLRCPLGGDDQPGRQVGRRGTRHRGAGSCGGRPLLDIGGTTSPRPVAGSASRFSRPPPCAGLAGAAAVRSAGRPRSWWMRAGSAFRGEYLPPLRARHRCDVSVWTSVQRSHCQMERRPRGLFRERERGNAPEALRLEPRPVAQGRQASERERRRRVPAWRGRASASRKRSAARCLWRERGRRSLPRSERFGASGGGVASPGQNALARAGEA